MSADPPDPRVWTRSKMMGIAGLILALHFGLIFWVAAVPEKKPRPAIAAAPQMLVLTDQQLRQLPDLFDPTLFVLPNRRGFSRQAWLKTTPMEHDVQEWEGPTRILRTPAADLGDDLAEMVRSNLTRPFEVASVPQALPEVADLYHTNLAVTESSLLVEGGLRSRPMLLTFNLSTQSSPAILSNTVVQLVVDTEGRLDSPPILVEKSGSDVADSEAVRLARTARFEPVRQAPGQPAPRPFTVGRMVFRWHTMISPPSTNAPGIH